MPLPEKNIAKKRPPLIGFYGLSVPNEKSEPPGPGFPACGPLPRPPLAALVPPGQLAHLLRGGPSVCDMPPPGPAGSPPRRGTPCCCITAASTRSTTSSPWRSWTSRCSSPSRQVGPPRGKSRVLSASRVKRLVGESHPTVCRTSKCAYPSSPGCTSRNPSCGRNPECTKMSIAVLFMLMLKIRKTQLRFSKLGSHRSVERVAIKTMHGAVTSVTLWLEKSIYPDCRKDC